MKTILETKSTTSLKFWRYNLCERMIRNNNNSNLLLSWCFLNCLFMFLFDCFFSCTFEINNNITETFCHHAYQTRIRHEKIHLKSLFKFVYVSMSNRKCSKFIIVVFVIGSAPEFLSDIMHGSSNTQLCRS